MKGSFTTLGIIVSTVCHYAEWRVFFVAMLNVVMLSVIMLSVVMLSVVMLSEVMLNVFIIRE